MTKRVGFIILAFVSIELFCILGCYKQCFRYDFSNGKASALLNNNVWNGQGRGYENQIVEGFDMSYEVYNKHGFLRQSLLFIKIPTTPGRYSLHNTSGQTPDTLTGSFFITSSDDGDVTEDIYNVLENIDTSYVEILSYDENKRWLEGYFKATYFIKPGRPRKNEHNADTLRFVSGTFEVRIEE